MNPLSLLSSGNYASEAHCTFLTRGVYSGCGIIATVLSVRMYVSPKFIFWDFFLDRHVGSYWQFFPVFQCPKKLFLYKSIAFSKKKKFQIIFFTDTQKSISKIVLSVFCSEIMRHFRQSVGCKRFHYNL